MSQIARNIEGLIGNTPLLELSKTEKALNLKGRVLAKLEFANPGRSVKDRVALALINQAEREGLINKGTTIIEPTSGNTGVGLAIVAASRGYKIILTMPDSMTIERRKLLSALGARLELTPAYEGMPGAIRRAQQLAREIGNAFIPQQFANKANPEAHRKTTAQEILRDTEGKVDIFISGVGTGGTITGVGEVLRQHNPDAQIIAVEPHDSAVLSGHKPGPHKLQGIGAGFVPPVLNTNIYDEIFRVKNDDAFETARVLAEQEVKMAETKKLSLIAFSGDFDKLTAVFTLATGAAAVGYEVNIFFTFWGLDAIKQKKGRAFIGSNWLTKTFGYMMGGLSVAPNSRFNFLGIGPKIFRYLMRKNNVATLEELVEAAGALGVNMYACEMAMHILGLKKSDFIHEVKDVLGVATFLNISEGGRTLFI